MSRCGKIISNFGSLYYYTTYILIIFISCLTYNGYGQTISGSTVADTTTNINDSINTDSTAYQVTDTTNLRRIDSVVADTSRKKMLEDSLGIKISKDELPAVVTAEATDSAVLDMKHDLFYLYGQAKVHYQDLNLNAGKITYKQASNIVTAEPLYDSAGIVGDRPSFAQGQETFTYDSLQYNFKSKRAIVRNVRSQYGEGYMFSQQVKRNPDQSIYGWHSVYTTCALDTPHYGIVAKKIKVIPGHLIVTGPADIVIEGVPTPLYLPFGLFPISQTQRSGFVIPTYTIEEARGLGLTNGGYYFNLSDHADLLMQTNIYTKGSYSVSGVSTYKSMYQYSGGVSLSYAYNKTGEDFEPGASIQKDFMFNWRHQTDAKARPGQSFNASVTAGTSTFYSNNSYDPNQILQNQYQSNISYSKNWIGTPFSLTISALHNQDTRTRQVNVTLPDINFHITQINPFQHKNSIGTHWYDKITASYNLDALNRTTFYDSSFSLSNLSLNDFQNGMHQAIPINASYTILRFINMSFNINYDEYWYTQRDYRQYNLAEAAIDTNMQRGFFSARDFSTSMQLSTRIYGMKMFKTGNLRGIRHVLTPSVGFTYHPDFGASPFNYYYRSQIDSFNYQFLSPYQSSIIGYPTLGKAALVNFGINNNLQIKVRSSKDTTTGFKNVTLIDALGINTSYNAAADSFQWSPVAMNFRTNILDKINISGSASFDPYAFNYQTGLRMRETMLQQGTGIARFTNANLSVGANFHSKPVDKSKSPTNSEEYARLMRNDGYNDYVDLNIPWSFNFSYSLGANNNYSYYGRRDTLVLTQNLMVQGDFNLTSKWKVTVSSGYNFTYHQLTLTSIDIYRDLHCWQMHLQTIPFGPRKSYNFTLNVKAAVLQDLKLMRRRDYRDAAY